MQYALLGNTGLIVSRLAFGAMTFTRGNKDLGAIFKVGGDLARELVGRALEAGINFIDNLTDRPVAEALGDSWGGRP